MTNQELNLAIAEYDETVTCHGTQENGVVIRNNYGVTRYIDYCNNWSDLMPLVVEHGLSLLKSNEGYTAVSECELFDFYTTSPQIALCECLLLVLEEKAE